MNKKIIIAVLLTAATSLRAMGEEQLLQATIDGNTDEVRRLLDQNADVNAIDKDGWTPLLFAASRGHTAIARLLIDNNANVNVTTKSGAIPLMYAAFEGHTAIAQLLIGNKADVNATDRSGATPLIHTAYRGHVAIAQLLIDNNANVNATTKLGWTALIFAAYSGLESMVRALVDWGADISIVDRNGKTATDYDSNRIIAQYIQMRTHAQQLLARRKIEEALKVQAPVGSQLDQELQKLREAAFTIATIRETGEGNVPSIGKLPNEIFLQILSLIPKINTPASPQQE